MFFALAAGFAVGSWKLAGFTLGNVTATLLAGVLIGQLGITVGGPIKSAFFLLFLFAVGYGVGPQFFRGLGREGPRQILFSLIVLAALPRGAGAVRHGRWPGCRLCGGPLRRIANDLRRDRRRHRSDRPARLPAEQAKAYADAVPIGYAVTYLFGTIGSAIVLAQLGPKLIGVDLAAACADYERQMGARGTGLDPGAFSAYRSIELRAYRVDTGSSLVGPEARQLFPGLRVFIERVRRGDELIDADADTVLCAGDVIAVSGPRQTLLGEVEVHADEVHDVELLNLPATVSTSS